MMTITPEYCQMVEQNCSTRKFIYKLWFIITFEEYTKWNDDEQSFTITNCKCFSKYILSKYFKTNQYNSFQRSLNYWGFKSYMKKNNSICFKHEYFRKYILEYLDFISRKNCHVAKTVKIKSNRKRKHENEKPVVNGKPDINEKPAKISNKKLKSDPDTKISNKKLKSDPDTKIGLSIDLFKDINILIKKHVNNNFDILYTNTNIDPKIDPIFDYQAIHDSDCNIYNDSGFTFKSKSRVADKQLDDSNDINSSFNFANRIYIPSINQLSDELYYDSFCDGITITIDDINKIKW